MTVRVAFVLGLCAMAAAVLHGGIWTAGHDFVVNRFTGEFVFVPSEDTSDDAEDRATHAALTASGADDSFSHSLPRR